jgi:glycosyltransferase involved in cell wall biosynthesis
MKVLHWYPNFLGGGGVANAVLGLAKAQAGLGAEVAIASAAAEGKPLYQAMDEKIENIRLFCWRPAFTLRAGGLRYRKIPREGMEQIRAFKPDVLHIHGEFNPDNLQVPRLFDSPLVLSPHGAFHPVVLRKSKQNAKRLYIAASKRLLYRYVRAFHALSPAEADHIRSAIGTVLVYTIPQGASPHVIVPPNNEEAPVCDAQTIRLIFVGRLDIYTKGLDILVEAFANAVRATSERKLRLVLVGPDWRGNLSKLKQLAHQHGCVNGIMFTGAVTGRQVSELLAQCDIYIHLSRHEGFPLSLTEALLAGKPSILSTEIGTVSYPEVQALPHVRVIPPEKNAASRVILEFAERIDELRALAAGFREHIKAFFDWKRIAQAHLERYEELLGGGL